MSTRRRYAAFGVAASGDNTILAAPGAGKKIVVFGLLLAPADTTTAFTYLVRSGTSGTVHIGSTGTRVPSGSMASLGGHQKLTLPVGSHPWFEGDANAILNLNISAAFGISGCIVYEVQDA